MKTLITIAVFGLVGCKMDDASFNERFKTSIKETTYNQIVQWHKVKEHNTQLEDGIVKTRVELNGDECDYGTYLAPGWYLYYCTKTEEFLNEI